MGGNPEHSTPQGWPAGSFLGTVYQLGSSINVPQLLRKAEPIQEIVNISRVVICVPFTAQERTASMTESRQWQETMVPELLFQQQPP